MRYSIQSGKTVEEAVQKALDDLKISRDQANIEVIEEASKGFLGLIGGKEAIVKVAEKIETKDILDTIFDSPSMDSSVKKEKPLEEKTLVQEEIKKPHPKENQVESSIKLDSVKESKSQFVTVDEPDHIPEPIKMEDREVEKEVKKEEKVDISIEEKNAIVRDFISKVMESFGIAYSLDIQHKDTMVLVSIDGKKEETGIVIGKRGVTLDSIQYILSLILNSKTQVYNRVILDCSNYREKREATLENLARKMAKKALHTNRSVRLEPMTAQERRIIHAALGSVEGVSTHSEGKEPYRRVVIQKERKY